ncbi:MAG TPA: hypothetical protein VET23_13010 [Chitinophagaceae bacterium]|nr:hypothetical protein [Chitinophagaceae bacterium]
MRKYFWFLPLLLLLGSLKAFPQVAKIDSSALFTDDRTIELTLTTDFKKLLAGKLKMTEQPATFTIKLPDSSVYAGEIGIRARGITRKQSCRMPPIMLNFKTANSGGLRPLHKLKLVCGCSQGADNEKLLLKEYLAYKIYNHLTDMSFRVRLAHITYEDSKGKQKTYSQYAFLIEDASAMAKRNNCKDLQKVAYNTESTQRKQMTLVALFEYMIGNSDWSVPNYHNIKLLLSRKDLNAPPYVVPYDFDYAGLVNAYYAVPLEDNDDSKSVLDREYRGFARSTAELEETISFLNTKKEAIKNLVMNFEPLNEKSRKEAMGYIEDFYKIINDKSQVETKFIKEARKQ